MPGISIKAGSRLQLGIKPVMMPNLRGFIFALTGGYDIPILLTMLATLGLCVWAALIWDDDLHGICRTAAIAVVTSYHVNPHDLVLLLRVFAVALPSIRWRSASGLLFLLMATPILHGIRLILGGLWFVAPLVMLFLFVAFPRRFRPPEAKLLIDAPASG
jgi:hypothetical protein